MSMARKVLTGYFVPACTTERTSAVPVRTLLTTSGAGRFPGVRSEVCRERRSGSGHPPPVSDLCLNSSSRSQRPFTRAPDDRSAADRCHVLKSSTPTRPGLSRRPVDSAAFLHSESEPVTLRRTVIPGRKGADNLSRECTARQESSFRVDDRMSPGTCVRERIDSMIAGRQARCGRPACERTFHAPERTSR
jgi:hypothetical protein